MGPAEHQSTVTNHRTLEERVTAALRSAILMGGFRSGQRVTVEELAKRFQVSRTPVRDALKRLEFERLVEVVPRQHVLILGVDLQQLVHINRIRSVLEALAAREAARAMSDEQVRECGRLLDCCEDALDRGTLDEYGDYHIRFHLSIIRGHNNQRLRGMLEDIYDYIALVRTVALQIPEQQEQSRFEHRAIFDAIRVRDAGRAELLMRVHVDNFERHLEEVFRLLHQGDVASPRPDSVSRADGRRKRDRRRRA